MRLTVAVICSLVAVQLWVTLLAGELKVGYYDDKCSGVEDVVKSHVIKAIILNRGNGAALVRLIFHDCFVRDLATVARFMPAFVGKLRPVSALDNTYYRNNLDKVVNFNSDWQLLTQDEARGHVHEYADNAALWDHDFAASLLKLSKLPMPAGSKGEIRNKCSSINHR
uniref:Plant heme peroxidase family profile domain-containing protein n=1 Tax=Oryza glumipatula TaxID=40148 RepID=A0A0D9Y753_9ORYZ